MYKIFTLLLCSCCATLGFAQIKSLPAAVTDHQRVTPLEPTQLTAPAIQNWTATTPSATPRAQFTPATLRKANRAMPAGLWAQLDPATGRVVGICGEADEATYLQAAAAAFDLRVEELVETQRRTDALGRTHVRYEQRFSGYRVAGAEVRLHLDEDGQGYMLNGFAHPAPQLDQTQVPMSAAEAEGYVKAEMMRHGGMLDFNAEQRRFIEGEPMSNELVIYYPNNKKEARLAYEARCVPRLDANYLLYVDAQNGEVLDMHDRVCRIHAGVHRHDSMQPTMPITVVEEAVPAGMPWLLNGPQTANATDLLGQNRLINTYEVNSDFYLIDGSRTEMFQPGAGNLPNEPIGAVWTIDAANASIDAGDFSVNHVFSTNNSWNAPVSVSAHYNGGQAYEYFQNTFGRTSINGEGGTLVSIINVEDENGPMDNAFWNGQAIFYGNGNTAFQPLARSLDVAGHEMSHGVVQTTANLEYQGESGALNESYADIFGAMIDRDDWQIGEDVVLGSSFPSGALRDLSDPNQGGTGLSSPGWQPAHTDEQYTGSQDNGGVHINSGIPNRAFYLTASAIGKDKAERIYYRALDQYLTRTAQFIDARIATIQAAEDLYGAGGSEAVTVANSFTTVGIGSGAPTNNQTDVQTNPGADFVVMSDANDSQHYLFDGAANVIHNPMTGLEPPLSKPSVTDDGSAFVYIGQDQRMYAVNLDFTDNSFSSFVLQDETVWRNVAISRDGSKFAALTDDNDNRVWVYDFGSESWTTFNLYNPTYTQGVSTGDVVYADVLEWDFTGEYVLYDALNQIEGTFGDDIEYWDIGFVRVWNNAAANFGDGTVQKLFTGLPENTSVGNPTFSKNSEYIIAYDYIDGSDFRLEAVNLETSELGTIFENVGLSYPSYSPQDDRLLFDAQSTAGDQVLAVRGLDANKINGSGDPALFVNGGSRGTWFANGDRVLTGTADANTPELKWTVGPNPFSDVLELRTENVTESVTVRIVDIAGREIFRRDRVVQGLDVPTNAWNAGTYVVYLQSGNSTEQRLFVKF